MRHTLNNDPDNSGLVKVLWLTGSILFLLGLSPWVFEAYAKDAIIEEFIVAILNFTRAATD